MRLIVHLGFHKTGSTYLQHLLNDNHPALAERGIWYERQPGYPAHHFAAWALLMGDAALLEAMLANAAAAACHTVILSSEDLEAAPFNPEIVALIEETAARAGVSEIEWHVVLREPGACFTSLHAQLQHHVYADALTLLAEVMRKGMLFIADPTPGAQGTPYWCYSFDHHAQLAAFAETTRFPVLVHDYADAEPFPGWRLLARLGALDAIAKMPGEEGRNRRLGGDAVRAGYRKLIEEALGVEAPGLAPQIDACLVANLAAVPAFADAVGRRFAASHRDAIAAFGVADETQSSPRSRATLGSRSSASM